MGMNTSFSSCRPHWAAWRRDAPAFLCIVILNGGKLKGLLWKCGFINLNPGCFAMQERKRWNVMAWSIRQAVR